MSRAAWLLLTLLPLAAGCSALSDKEEDEDDGASDSGGGGWDLGTGTDGGDTDADTDTDGGDADTDGDTDTDGDVTDTDGGDTDTDTDTDGETSACDGVVRDTRPDPGATDVYHRNPIVFAIDPPDPSAEISLVGPSGAVSGRTSIDDDIVTFTPSSPLDPSSEYAASLDWCGDTAVVEFTTGSLGEPLSTSVAGRAYRLDLDGATFVEPAGVGDLLLGTLDTDLLVQVQSASSSSLTLMVAVAESGGDQDLCTPTSVLPAADFTDAPYWQLGPADTAFELDGISITMEDMLLSGTFASDGRTYGGSILDATIDTRTLPLEDLLGSDDPAAMCELVRSFGVDCETCPSDGEPLCLGVRIEDVTGDRYSGSLVIRTEAAIASDPDCF